jgi:predicted ABC-type ATPase
LAEQNPPQAVIIAGPNGSGKSTSATGLLPPGMPFVNADMIATELSGIPGTAGDINAGRLLIDRVRQHEIDRVDFAFETTLATRMLLTRVKEWKEMGYEVHLLYFWLPSDELAIHRVRSRVLNGGHHVPDETVRRRYKSSLSHFFNLYRHAAHTWRIYDNSGAGDPVLIAKLGRSGVVSVSKEELWTQLLKEYSDEEAD